MSILSALLFFHAGLFRAGPFRYRSSAALPSRLLGLLRGLLPGRHASPPYRVSGEPRRTNRMRLSEITLSPKRTCRIAGRIKTVATGPRQSALSPEDPVVASASPALHRSRAPYRSWRRRPAPRNNRALRNRHGRTAGRQHRPPVDP